ncbi:PepSY-associated TM helix domain-containing protein [Erythrobacteraceae bacterium WH01K]|nr:PepSY-associated TM helix domain-containing protein [Erythrobacteraceae bacterium WH01K]
MRVRPAFRFWHRWFGVLGGAWLILLAITGCAIAWYDELDGLLNPDLRYAELTTGTPASMDDVVASAEEALPGFAPGNILLSQSPDRTHWLIGRQTLSDDTARPLQVFVDPDTAEVTGWRESGQISLHRHYLPDLLYGLHTDLLLGRTGVLIVGFLALAWLLDHLLSLPLAFPRLRGAMAAFRIGGHAGSLRQLWDRHRASALWLWPITAMLALTGTTLSFPEESRHLVEPLSPISDRLHYDMEERGPPDTPIGIDAAIARVTLDRAVVHSVRPHPEIGLYAVRTFDDRDVDNQGRLWTYVDMATGAVVAKRHDAGQSGGDTFFLWQYALHSGHAFGLVGRLLVTLAGLVTIYLSFSGYRLWWKRRRRGL